MKTTVLWIFATSILVSGAGSEWRWDWWRHGMGFGAQHPHAMVLGGERLYVAGYFTDSLWLSDRVVRSEGGEDLFAAAYSLDGQLDWLVKGGAQGHDRAHAIAYEPGSIYLAGAATPLPGKSSKGSGNGEDSLFDAFVARYDTAGAPIWVRRLGSGEEEVARALALDSEGNVYVAGSFRESLSLGSAILRSRGWNDIFVSKLSPSGEFLWSRRLGGTGHDQVMGLIFQPGEGLYLGGHYQDSLEAEDGKGGLRQVRSIGGQDFFVALFSDSGNLSWLSSSGSEGNDMIHALAGASGGGIFLAGEFHGTLVLGGESLWSRGGTDAFVAHCGAGGSVNWVRTGGGRNDDAALFLAGDSAGGLVVGAFGQDTLKWGEEDLVLDPQGDYALLRLDSVGRLQSMQPLQSSGVLRLDGLQCLPGSKVAMLGSFRDRARLGPLKLHDPSGEFKLLLTVLKRE